MPVQSRLESLEDLIGLKGLVFDVVRRYYDEVVNPRFQHRLVETRKSYIGLSPPSMRYGYGDVVRSSSAAKFHLCYENQMYNGLW